ncbi:hypothetical protein AKJ16_DCAP23618 [Drosera capensis]
MYGLRLRAENQKLKQKVVVLSQGKGPVKDAAPLLTIEEADHSDMVMHEEGQSMESVTTSDSSSSSGPPPAEDDCSDATLNLSEDHIRSCTTSAEITSKPPRKLSLLEPK